MLNKWKIGDRVKADFDGELYPGEVASKDRGKCLVLFDDGEEHWLTSQELQPEEPSIDDKSPDPRDRKSIRSNTPVSKNGFNQYGIEFSDQAGKRIKNEDDLSHAIYLHLIAEDLQFHGMIRKTRVAKTQQPAWAVDIWVKIDDQSLSVDTIPYFDVDPRLNVKSLAADVCANVNRWLHFNRSVVGDLERIRRQAEYPEIYFNRLQSLDQFILKLEEFRAVSMSSGGTRSIKVTGDRDDGPTVILHMDFTTQAIALEGKVPSKAHGAVFDRVTGKKGQKGQSITNKPDAKSVESLLNQLDATDDPGEARKIRALLRRIGHKGGRRAFEKQQAETVAEPATPEPEVKPTRSKIKRKTKVKRKVGTSTKSKPKPKTTRRSPAKGKRKVD